MPKIKLTSAEWAMVTHILREYAQANNSQPVWSVTDTIDAQLDGEAF